MRKLTIVAVVSVLSACGDMPMNGPDATLSKVPANAPCTATLAEYCAGGRCPTFDEAVARRVPLCTQPGTQRVETRVCAGLYRSVAWSDFVLGGGEEYFDAAGRLTAAPVFSDHLGAYCFRSGAQTAGTIPVCSGAITVTSLCP